MTYIGNQCCSWELLGGSSCSAIFLASEEDGPAIGDDGASSVGLCSTDLGTSSFFSPPAKLLSLKENVLFFVPFFDSIPVKFCPGDNGLGDIGLAITAAASSTGADLGLSSPRFSRILFPADNPVFLEIDFLSAACCCSNNLSSSFFFASSSSSGN